MLGKATCISLGIQRPELKSCSFQIQTSLGGANDRSHFMTRERFSMQMKPEHATYSYNITTLALGSRPRQGGCKVVGQEGGLGVTSHDPEGAKSLRE
jgi:hypothetical protein